MYVKERISVNGNEHIRNSYPAAKKFTLASTDNKIFMLDVSDCNRLLFFSDQAGDFEVVVYDQIGFVGKGDTTVYDFNSDEVTTVAEERLLAVPDTYKMFNQGAGVLGYEDKSEFVLTYGQSGGIADTFTTGMLVNRVNQYAADHLFFDQKIDSSKYLLVEVYKPTDTLYTIMGVKDESTS